MYTQIRARARDALTLNFDRFLNLDLVLGKNCFVYRTTQHPKSQCSPQVKS